MTWGLGTEVAIVGGGPAGAVAALVLARRGVAVTVIEAEADSTAKAGETLPPAVAPLLRQLGLVEALTSDGHLRSQRNRSFWGSSTAGENPFIASPYGEGWHLDRRNFEGRLKANACQAGVQWLSGTRVTSCAESGEGWKLELTPSQREEKGSLEDRKTDLQGHLNASIVADATGRTSRIARRLGARRQRTDRLVGIHGSLYSSIPDTDNSTLVESTPDGWWYSANLPSGRLAVCFFSDGDLMETPLLQGHSRAWTAQLQSAPATQARIESNGYQLCREPRALPAESSRLDRIAGPNWLALGDAAAAYDPLSSYGITSAMGSGFYAGNALVDHLAGRKEATDAYLGLMQHTYATYLELLGSHYSRERRWPSAPFWRRRHEQVTSSVA